MQSCATRRWLQSCYVRSSDRQQGSDGASRTEDSTGSLIAMRVRDIENPEQVHALTSSALLVVGGYPVFAQEQS